jgi:hypothetical protein
MSYHLSAEPEKILGVELSPGVWPHVAFDIPVTERMQFDSPSKGIDMEFRLTYEGSLRAKKDHEQSHAIRRQFHRQLSTLWATHGLLKPLRESSLRFERLIEPRYGFNFVPLVRESLSLGCGLDILFLRREAPGRIVSGGDIDNRITVLVDALTMPENREQVRGITPEADEDPLFCLLEKDKFIYELNVTTDRLLWPAKPGEDLNSVHIVIQVKVIVLDPSKTWVGWGL